MTQETNARERTSASPSVGVSATANPASGDGERDTAVDGIEALHDSQLTIALDGTIGAAEDGLLAPATVAAVPPISIREALAAQDDELRVSIPDDALRKGSVPPAPHTQRSMTALGLGDAPRLSPPTRRDASAGANPPPVVIATPEPRAHSTLLGMPEDVAPRPTLDSAPLTMRESETFVSADELAAESLVPATVASPSVPSVKRAGRGASVEPRDVVPSIAEPTRTASLPAVTPPPLLGRMDPAPRPAFGAWPVVAFLVSLVVIAVGFTLKSRPSESKTPTAVALPGAGSMPSTPMPNDTAAGTGAATQAGAQATIRQSPASRLAEALAASAAASPGATSLTPAAIPSAATSSNVRPAVAGPIQAVQTPPASAKSSATKPQATAKANSTDPLDLGSLLKGE